MAMVYAMNWKSLAVCRLSHAIMISLQLMTTLRVFLQRAVMNVRGNLTVQEPLSIMMQMLRVSAMQTR